MHIVDVIQQDSLFPNFENSHRHKEKILYAMVAPILFGLLVGLKHEVIESCRGIDKILLRELARNYREGDGDCGICFEYAVHSAIRNNNPLVIERIQEALSLCGIEGRNTTSILLGFEKSRILQINNELLNTLTDNSILVSNINNKRIRIKKYLEEIIYVFLTIFLYLPKCPQSLILSALRAFCFCGKPHISRSIFLYFRYQTWLKSW